MKLDFIDVRRAYFHAKAKREMYIELPMEDSEEGMCGILRKSMYGTRDAAQNWEEEYTSFLKEIGFTQGKSSPCTFHHGAKNLRLVVHGDDFTILGPVKSLDWFRVQIAAAFEAAGSGQRMVTTSALEF